MVESPAVTSHAASVGVATIQRCSILIVEDDEGLRDSLQDVLQRQGYDVTTAKDGGEALHYLDSHTPDAALVDVAMRPIGGLRTLKSMRKRGLKLPVLLMSDGWRAERTLPAGCQGLLRKPFLPETLIAVLRATLARPATVL